MWWEGLGFMAMLADKVHSWTIPSIHPSTSNTIHLLSKLLTSLLLHSWLWVAGVHPSCAGVKARLHPGRIASLLQGHVERQTTFHIHTYCRDSSEPRIWISQSFKEKRQLTLKLLSFVGETLLINAQRIQKGEFLFYAYMTSLMLWLRALFEDTYLFPMWWWETHQWSREFLFPYWVWMSGHKGWWGTHGFWKRQMDWTLSEVSAAEIIWCIKRWMPLINV